MAKYTVTGMSCAACQNHVEKAVALVPGVTSVSVSLLTNSMQVEGSADSNEIVTAVEKAGYGAFPAGSKEKTKSGEDALKDTETPKLKKRLIASLILLVPLMYISMGHMMWGWPLPEIFSENHVAMGIVQMLLTIFILVINQKFFISGVTSCFHKSPNMDTLVALGAGASFGYSLYVLLAMTNAQMLGDRAMVMEYMHDFYFESAAMIVTLITVGKMLESYSKGKTTDALKSLMKLAPKTAVIIMTDESGKEIEREISVEQISTGDIFVVRPGENIPVDGIVIDGMSAVDESAITGESIPIDKTIGSNVSSATMNQSGFIKCKATRVGEDTTLSQIIQMVSDAATTKAPIAKVADRVSGIFVPVVIVIALITIVVWLVVGESVGFAIARGVSVLVISCPCALGLATPVAIMVGNGVGAKNGILFKNATAIENAGKTQIVALDKTGTVTVGKPVVTDIIPNAGVVQEELLSVAYALEAKSEHPLAKAIVKYAQENDIEREEILEFQAEVGNGLTGKLSGESVLGGNSKFISRIGKISEDLFREAEQLSNQGKTPLFFAKNHVVLGIIAVADVIKEESPKAIKELKDMGIHAIMLTGDNKNTAKTIGAQAGVDEIVAEVVPQEKESVIRKLNSEGKTAMVGDGINDAPALTRADIGIAIGAGTDVAIDAADIVLMKSRLSDVPAAIRLSRAVLKNIHENLFWAFIYNIIGIPLAAGLWYPIFGIKLNPMFGAAAMSLSSFCVVTNALRLNLLNIRKVGNPIKKSVKINSIELEENPMGKIVRIEGMMCENCERHVKKALEAIDGVSAKVDYKAGMAEIQGDVTEAQIKSAIEEEGYKFIGIE